MDWEQLQGCEGIQWDEGNAEKSWEKHRVTRAECEQVYFNRPLVTGTDAAHSQGEPRYFALGTTERGRYLFIVFTIRSKLIRVISARDMNRRERKVFEDATEEE